MARPTTASWTKLLIMLGNAASPEVFTAPCALTTKGISFSADTSDSNVPDCDDPDAPSWVERVKRSLSAGITGSGRLAMESLPTWWNFYKQDESKNVRVKLDVSAANNGGHWAGKFVLTAFNIEGNENDGKIGVSVTLASDGEVVWVPAT